MSTDRSNRSAVRVGGQALPDGVVMRTGRAWAIARADGSVDSGVLPPPRLARVPVLRVLVGLVLGLRIGLGRGDRSAAGRPRRSLRANWPFLRGLLITEVVAMALNAGADHLHAPRSLAPIMGAGLCLVALGVFRVAAPSTQWRYHGAEHKAVAAHEGGCDLEDTAAVLAFSRVHPRCGTNLVVWAALLAPLAQRLPLTGQLVAIPVVLGGIAEVISIAARHPKTLPSRVLLAPGMALQALVTTAEPTFAEQAVGARALRACLERHAAAEAEAAVCA